MTCEVIVDVQPKKIAIALTEDKRLVEYQEEEQAASFNVGNIYFAKVRKLMPGLNACFVNVGHERDAFLHYLDLGPQYHSFAKYLKQLGSDKKKIFPMQKASIQPELPKEGSVQNVLQLGQELLVQIVKEPISTKGPRLTCEIIVRTVAEGKKVQELDQELMILLKRWDDAIARAHAAKDLPCLCYEETNRTVALLRDLFNPTYENIYINDPRVYDEVKDYVKLIAPEMQDIVKLYKGKLPIFDNFDVTRQIKTSFGKTVSYKHGAYLIIEHTEALHVVDVNSGNRAKNPDGQEANALEVNLGAADELARQLRLRDMGGIIVVDFIDMNVAEDRQKLYERMVENMKRDRARHNILPLSKFGLMQITRQRVRPVMEVHVDETCPTCMGKGTIKSSFLFTDLLEQKIDQLVNHLQIRAFVLHVHPYVAAYINQGFVSLKRRWQMKYGFGIRIIPNQRLAFLQYEFFTPKGEEIDMKAEEDMK